jgi:hypothetical protein
MRRWLLLPCLALLGCRSASYTPVEPRVVRSPAGELRLERVRLWRTPGNSIDDVQTWLSATLAGNLPQPGSAVRVYLNSAYGDACRGEPGHLALSAGKLTASWRLSGSIDLQGPTSLDVQLPSGADHEGSCVRLPLASGAVAGQLREEGRGEWLMFWRLSLEFGSSPVTSSIISTSLGTGTWLGPLRVSLSTGVGSARCSASLCGEFPTENGEGTQLAAGLSLPVDFEIEGFVWSRHTSALSLSLRPGFRLSWFDEAPELHRRMAFTPALVVSYWATAPRDRRPLLAQYAQPERLEGAGIALEVPIGLWQDLDRDRPTGFFVGFGTRFALPID